MPDTEIGGALKHFYYEQNGLINLLRRVGPVMRWILGSQVVAGGEDMIKADLYNFGASAGADYQKVQARKNDRADVAQWNLEWQSLYAVQFISNKEQKQSLKAEGAVDNMAKIVGSSLFMQAIEKLSRDIYASGYGEIGQVADITNLGSDELTVKDAQNIVPKMSLVFADAVASGGLRGGAGVTPLKVQEISGNVLTFSGSPPAGLAVDDYLFIDGDRDNNPVIKNFYGFCSWMPLDRSILSSSFCGVKRSRWADVLAGSLVRSSNSKTLEEVLIEAQAAVYARGGSPRHLLMNPKTYAKYLTDATKRSTFFKEVNTTGSNLVNYRMGGGKIEAQYNDDFSSTVVQDWFCPPDVIYMVDLDQWVLALLGDSVDNVEGYEGISVPSMETFVNKLTSDISVYPANGGTSPGVDFVLEWDGNFFPKHISSQCVIDLSQGVKAA